MKRMVLLSDLNSTDRTVPIARLDGCQNRSSPVAASQTWMRPTFVSTVSSCGGYFFTKLAPVTTYLPSGLNDQQVKVNDSVPPSPS